MVAKHTTNENDHSVVCMKDGKKDGPSIYITKLGGDRYLIREVMFYVVGVPHGVNVRYHENGQMQYQESYNQGRLHGEYISYHKNGKPKTICVYDTGKINGVEITYDKEGTMTFEIPYINGQKHGV